MRDFSVRRSEMPSRFSSVVFLLQLVSHGVGLIALESLLLLRTWVGDRASFGRLELGQISTFRPWINHTCSCSCSVVADDEESQFMCCTRLGHTVDDVNAPRSKTICCVSSAV